MIEVPVAQNNPEENCNKVEINIRRQCCSYGRKAGAPVLQQTRAAECGSRNIGEYEYF